jgi:hypothetical protein
MTKFTIKEFKEEICRFRQHFGNKSWWEKPEETREECVRGLSYMYLNLYQDNGEMLTDTQMNEVTNLLDCTLTEYNYRAILLRKSV